jgi:hypothetical protein
MSTNESNRTNAASFIGHDLDTASGIIDGLQDVEEDLDVATSAMLDEDVNHDSVRAMLVRLAARVTALRKAAAVRMSVPANDGAEGAA